MASVRARPAVGALGAHDAVSHQARHNNVGQAGRLLGGRVEVRARDASMYALDGTGLEGISPATTSCADLLR
nr:hypothetical protein GCM10020063_023620 [Dactylosporangium thailandense]